ncbi:hypothetical protein ABZT17_09745 [Streptomyces sp. NPDC005648]|uniref:hypothetical protein n=1 Tax=Streptomyces sp. NPDC005648 TaxID=3157044 RepID=UPI0033ABAB62
MVTPADAQNSLAARELLFWAKQYLDITTYTVRRPPDAKGFVVLTRWAVERYWSWIVGQPSLPRPRTAA